MSNEEKRKRLNYRTNRKKWINFQTVLIIILTIITAFFATTYYRKDRDSYIQYIENSNVDYKVYLKENPTFDEEYLGKDHETGYIASLIDNIVADFSYELKMDAENVDYEYSYRVDGVVEIFDKTINQNLYHPTISLVDEKKLTQNSNSNLKINEQVTIDYNYYNGLVQDIIDVYDLYNVTSTLIVTTHISVIGICDAFENNSSNHYSISLKIPLTTQTLGISITSTIPVSENKILACNNNDASKVVFLKSTIISGGLDFVLIIVLVVYTLLTRNTDINYERKVKKILSQYKSFIQVLKNEFVTDGYQVLCLSSIRELLEIRDTLQKPILMKENDDRTASKFMIPTNDNIVYVYEIRVEDYEELYSEQEVVEPENTTPVVEELVTTSNSRKIKIRQEVVFTNKVKQEENPIKENNEETKEEQPAEEKDIFGTRHNYSFEAKMSLSDFQTRHHHKEIMDFVTSYGLKVSRSWKQERVYVGKKTIAVLSFKGKKLCVALPLNPADYADSKYKFVDMTSVKRYQSTPLLFKITSERKVKHILELLKVVLEKEGIENQNLQVVNKKVSSKHKNALIKKGLIKVTDKDKQTV